MDTAESSPHGVLVVAAHPDDEVLGCGGTMARFAGQGVAVNTAFLADGVGARQTETGPNRDQVAARQAAAVAASKALGTRPPTFDTLPDNQFDTRPLLEITRKVEQLIAQHQPEIVFTHHAGDLNIDHRLVHQAVLTACRPQPGHCVRRLLFFETASSTEWQPPGSASVFQPSAFFDITATLDSKLAALEAYATEMRAWPHARSIKALEHLARWRGASVGMEAAEAFMVGRELI